MKKVDFENPHTITGKSKVRIIIFGIFMKRYKGEHF